MKKYLTLIIFSFLFVGKTFAQADIKANTEDLRTIVTLLDYIAKDYAGAVKNGKIINDFEYAEMEEFTRRCSILHAGLQEEIDTVAFEQLQVPLDSLKAAVINMADVRSVAEQALAIKNNILNLGILKIGPLRWPSISHGKTLYKTYCATCHGPDGGGDGVAAQGLEPAPSSFQDDELMDMLSPFQAYNVIKLGVEGTSMASYDNVLSEKDIWDLSFFLMTLRYGDVESPESLPDSLQLDQLSRWTDPDLQAYISTRYPELTARMVRAYEPERLPPLNVAEKKLEKSYKAYRSGKRDIAQKYALASYLEGIELVENVLKASSPEIVNKLERDMIAYRKAISDVDGESVTHYYHILKEEINTARAELEGIDYSFAFMYGAAFSILLREALEALLIILIILSILKPLNIRNAIPAVHIGWIIAVAIGFAGWFFTDNLVTISGASRELMEGIGAAIAVIVLLYAGVWLHSHSEVKKWTTFVKEKVSDVSSSGSLVGLAVFSFIVVFREAFEVVLFLASLKLNNPETADSAFMWALITAVVVIGIIAYLFMRYTHRLPLGKIFRFSYYVIAILAVILTGKAVSAFQEVGYLSINLLDFMPQIDILGIYPNVQCISAQFLVLLLLFFLNWRTSMKA